MGSENYRKWIEDHREDWYQCTSTEWGYILDTEWAQAFIRFTDIENMEICEFRIVSRLQQKTEFYLHFQLNSKVDFIEMYEEMLATLKQLSARKTVQVLLCCTSAITTSYFAGKLQETSSSLSLPYTFQAVSFERLYVRAHEFDIVLLAPQLGFRYKEIKTVLPDMPVVIIPAGIFGRYDVSGLIRLVEESLAQREDRHEVTEAIVPVRNNKNILIIVAAPNRLQKHYLYRIYKQGCILLSNEVIKPGGGVSLQDIMDITELVVPLYPDLEAIGITMTGIVDQGKITLVNYNIIDVDFKNMLETRWHLPVYIDNNVNSAALGYQLAHPECHSLVFHSQPVGFTHGGEGIIVGGHLVRGLHNMAGEVQHIFRKSDFEDPALNAWTQEGMLRLVTESLAAAISIIDPELVVLRCPLIPDTDLLKKSLLDYFGKEEYLPPIVKADDAEEYMFAGHLRHCLHEMQRSN